MVELDTWLVCNGPKVRPIWLSGMLFAPRRLPALPAGEWARCGELEFRVDEPLPEEDVAQALFLLSGGTLDGSGVVALSWLGNLCIGYSLRTPDVLWVAQQRGTRHILM